MKDVLIVHDNGWSIHMREKESNIPAELAKVMAVLKMLGEIK